MKTLTEEQTAQAIRIFAFSVLNALNRKLIEDFNRPIFSEKIKKQMGMEGSDDHEMLFMLVDSYWDLHKETLFEEVTNPPSREQILSYINKEFKA